MNFYCYFVDAPSNIHGHICADCLFLGEGELCAVKGGKVVLHRLCPTDQLETAVAFQQNFSGAELAVVV